MSDKKKAPLFEVRFTVDDGGISEVKTYRLRAKSECNAHYEFGRFVERKKINNVEVLTIASLTPVKREASDERPTAPQTGEAGAKKVY